MAVASESNKLNKYNWRCEPLEWEFIGAAVESIGALGPGFHTIVDRLAAASPRSDFPGRSWACPSFKSYILQCLSIIIQTGGCKRVRQGWARLIGDLDGGDPSFGPELGP